MANVQNIRAGFTGELAGKSKASEKAKQAASYVKGEADAVARGAQNHPSATGTVVLLIGAAAFLAGYLIGSSTHPPERSRFW